MNTEPNDEKLRDELLDALIDAEALLIGGLSARDWAAARSRFLTKARALIRHAKGGTP